MLTGLIEEDVAVKLNADDQNWIRNIVQDSGNGITKAIPSHVAQAIESIRPHGWKKAAYLLREWGVLGTTATVIVSLLGITLATLYQSFAHVREETQFRTHTDDRLEAIEKQMVSLVASVALLKPDARNQIGPLLKERAAGKGAELQFNLSVAEKLIEGARAQSLHPDPVTVGDAGKSFVQLTSDSKDDPTSVELAWKGTQAVLDYRTDLNRDLRSVQNAQEIATTPENPRLQSIFVFNAPLGYASPKFSVGGDVPADQGAIIYPLSASRPNVGKPDVGRGKQVALAEGGTIELDDLRMRHVVLRGTKVFYYGGPTELLDVVFVGCTFVLKNAPQTQQFALAVFSSAPTTFSPTHI